MNRKLSSIATLALILAAGAASAQPTQGASEARAESDESIMVTGTRLSREEARRQAIEFIQGTGVAAGDRPVARWLDPVCIRVTGIDEAPAELVAARMARAATAAGIAVARGRCTPNVVVSFTTNADALIQRLAARSPRRLTEANEATRERLLRGEAPIRWWYTTGMRGRHGMSDGTSAAPFASNDGTGANPPIADVPTMYQYNSSIVSTQVARSLLAATVIVDANRAEGMPLYAVADYAAMVAFAEIREDDFASPASVLGMFGNEGAPRALTDWDKAFLRVLYQLPLDRQARQHRGLLVRDLLQAVEDGS